MSSICQRELYFLNFILVNNRAVRVTSDVRTINAVCLVISSYKASQHWLRQ